MNISKNILSLGFIAIISGISTAQTYTGTAGTNGVTDIQSDYSMSTGDGASVSVDVPLEFELPKKVAIAVNAGSGLPANSLFDGINCPVSNLSGAVDLTPHNSTYFNLSKNALFLYAGVYANAEAIITATAGEFIHESDPNSVISARSGLDLGARDGATPYFYGGQYHEPNTTTAGTYTHSITMDTANAISQNNQGIIRFHSYMYLDTVDPTDRAGKYIQNVTLSVTTL